MLTASIPGRPHCARVVRIPGIPGIWEYLRPPLGPFFGHFFGPTRSLIWPLGPFPDLLGHICGHQAIFRPHHWHILGMSMAYFGHISDMSMAHFGHIPGCQGPLWACPWPFSGTYINIRAHFGHILGMSLARFGHIHGHQGPFQDNYGYVHGQFRAHPLISGHILGTFWTRPWPISVTYKDIRAHFGHIHGPFRTLSGNKINS